MTSPPQGVLRLGSDREVTTRFKNTIHTTQTDTALLPRDTQTTGTGDAGSHTPPTLRSEQEVAGVEDGQER